MVKFIHNRQFVFSAIAILVVLGLVISLVVYGGKTSAYAVKLNDKQILIAKDEDAVKKLINKMEAAETKRIGHKVALAEDITYKRVLVEENEIANQAEIPKLLEKTLKMKTTAVCIKVNSTPVVYVASQSVAKKLLADLKKQNAECGDNERIKSVKFLEKIAISTADVPSTEVTSYKEAMNMLRTGDKSPVYYTVKQGDSLWWIARKNDMHVVDLMAANNLNSDKLDLDQKLVIATSKPYVNVMATIEGNKKEAIPFETKVIIDKSKQYGVSEKQKGHDGERKIAYEISMRNGNFVERKVISQKIITEPVAQILVRGKRANAMVASRGKSRFSGSFLWPAIGHITSYFGSRHGHTGIDIDGDTGDPIQAAQAGVVIFAGRSGGYGNQIIIDHGNGVKTRYAHCSKLLVSKGQRVTKGQTIAKVGSTGHSTGSHLHFEVINGGALNNPLSYLK
ncbi:MAG: peptidoglycan DD-metalloendopeptidase family protein [Ignavibacteriales bacterium]